MRRIRVLEGLDADVTGENIKNTKNYSEVGGNKRKRSYRDGGREGTADRACMNRPVLA